jgi:hypothetical protein
MMTAHRMTTNHIHGTGTNRLLVITETEINRLLVIGTKSVSKRNKRVGAHQGNPQRSAQSLVEETDGHRTIMRMMADGLPRESPREDRVRGLEIVGEYPSITF